MSHPLSPKSPATLNRAAWASPFSTIKKTATQSSSPALRENIATTWDDDGPPSSPFQTEVEHDRTLPTALPSPVRSRAGQRSPTKTFEIHEDVANEVSHAAAVESENVEDQGIKDDPSARPFNKRAMGDETLSSVREQIHIEHAQPTPVSELPVQPVQDEGDEHDAPSMMSDDTCFSTFSAIPNADMTMFAQLGNTTRDHTIRSPTRPLTSRRDFYTPRTSRKQPRLGSSRSPSPTPRARQASKRDGDTTNLLLDFTGQFDPSRSLQVSPRKQAHGSPNKSSTEPNLLSYINNQRMPSPTKGNMATPSNRRNLMNLLDFDLPPQPTPRSMPTITVRELESLKSQYLSEISSLKASLSGREAEVDSLKKAVNDAERRVGEAQESLRDEKNARNHAEKEKESWEKKGQEVEAVLRSVREEFESADKEREELLQKLEESNRQCEEAELRAEEASTKVTVAQGDVGVANSNPEQHSLSEEAIAQRVNDQLDEKMESLARELHTVYKKKHESKVATLKKTYEARSEKKCNELQQMIVEMARQMDELQASKDSTFSGEMLDRVKPADQLEQEEKAGASSAEFEEQKARLAGLMEELMSLQQSNDHLMQEVERERVEKGELVAAVDEMLMLQSESAAPSVIEDFRKSISRPPASVRGGGIPAPKASGIMAPGKSRIMSNIERMGSARGAH